MTDASIAVLIGLENSSLLFRQQSRMHATELNANCGGNVLSGDRGVPSEQAGVKFHRMEDVEGSSGTISDTICDDNHPSEVVVYCHKTRLLTVLPCLLIQMLRLFLRFPK